MNAKFLLALAIAVGLDLLDFTVGWIPIAGDVLDVIGIIVLLPLIGTYAIIGAAEFIPVIGDFIPFFTGAVIMSKAKFGEK